jgi:cytochrome c556
MIADSIGYDLSILAKNIATLQQQASSMPEPTEVKQVEGGGDQPGEVHYTTRLTAVATLLADRVNKVRKFVTYNADALNAAAQALGETDSTSDQAATQATTFIDSIVETSPTAGGSGGSTKGSGSGGTSTRSDF